MGETFTPAEIRQQYLETMGPELGRLFNALAKDVVWLHGKWDQFRMLYARTPERVELLNRTAKFFFGMCQHMLWEDVLLHIARLVDSKSNRHQANLSLAQLQDHIEDPLRAQYADLVQTAYEKADFARVWRHKLLAHRDLGHALKEPARPLPSATRENVTEALTAIAAAMNCLELHYRNHFCHYDEVIAPLDDVNALVRYLQAGLEAEEQRRARIASGNPLPSDLKPSEV
jgi:hypothetical protein